jgi:hypothetical protein
MGPHYLSIRDPRNARDRSPVEEYVSPPLAIDGGNAFTIDWDADVPDGTDLRFDVRHAVDAARLEAVGWTPVQRTAVIPGSAAGGVLQYRAVFESRTAARSPRLRAVRFSPA